ncbi:hypothetical protein [Streptomyces sp. NPDC017890]|uniref:hypothetical protein n=1 Tax=Streptomyces sp. NPDC017890 TaxID=3365015 RepID=UPI0037977913
MVINAEGKRLLSRRVANDECELLALISDVLEMSQDVLWEVPSGAGLRVRAVDSRDSRTHLRTWACNR